MSRVHRVSVSAFVYEKDGGGTRDANDRIKYTIASRYSFHTTGSRLVGGTGTRGTWMLENQRHTISPIDWALTNDNWKEKCGELLHEPGCTSIDTYLFLNISPATRVWGESYAIFNRLQFTLSTPRKTSTKMDCHFLRKLKFDFLRFHISSEPITNWCASIACVRKCKRSIDWRSMYTLCTHWLTHTNPTVYT